MLSDQIQSLTFCLWGLGVKQRNCTNLPWNKTSLVPGTLLFMAAFLSFSLSHHWISETLRPRFSSAIQSPRGTPAALCLFGSRLPLRPHGEDLATDTRSSPSLSQYTFTTHIRLWASLAWLHPLWLPACESEWGADGENLSRLWLPWVCSGISTCPFALSMGSWMNATVCAQTAGMNLSALEKNRKAWIPGLLGGCHEWWDHLRWYGLMA